jgi:hypothetical protein
LRERYYYVTQTILQRRNPLPDPVQKAEMTRLAYEKEKEIERKQAIQKYLQRPEHERLVRLCLYKFLADFYRKKTFCYLKRERFYAV